MKKFLLLFSFIILLSNCAPQSFSKPNGEKNSMKPQVNDDGEYDLVVFDSQYDYFLSAIARPMNNYTEDYLKMKNRFLVTEWNNLYSSNRYPNVIESSIDYDPTINYGLKYEYKLYQVFTYVYWKYGLKLNGISRGDLR